MKFLFRDTAPWHCSRTPQMAPTAGSGIRTAYWTGLVPDILKTRFPDPMIGYWQSAVCAAWLAWRQGDNKRGAPGWSLSPGALKTIQNHLLDNQIIYGQPLPDPGCHKDNHALADLIRHCLAGRACGK